MFPPFLQLLLLVSSSWTLLFRKRIGQINWVIQRRAYQNYSNLKPNTNIRWLYISFFGSGSLHKKQLQKIIVAVTQ